MSEHNEIIKGKVLLASYRKSDIYRDMHKFKEKVKKVAIRYTGKIPEIVKISNLDALAHTFPEESFINGVIGLNFLRKMVLLYRS